jgi:tetratricopeptide (TPR) repeat protein
MEHTPARALVIALILGLSFSCGGCSVGPTEPLSPEERFHLGDHHFPISTEVEEAQQAFDRGLLLAYAFNHGAAEAAFRRAAELDPAAPMPWWGIALVNGPHINFPLVPEENGKRAWEALERARAQAPGRASPLESALIDALARRYRADNPPDRAKLDQGYAEAMAAVSERYADNADVAALYAESLMDLRPWDLWTKEGTPQPGTETIVSVLERAIEVDPEHPLAHHLYIHAIEASPNPEKALPSAERLGGIAPGAGHLVHMPAHIFARVGMWKRSVESNAAAMDADDHAVRDRPNPGFYAIYMSHNRHFRAFSEMMRGRKAESVRLAREVVGKMPEPFLQEYGPVADGFMVFVHEVLMRFGAWDELLAEPAPRGSLPLSTALWRFTRASAYTALGRSKEAMKERARFLSAAKAVPADAVFGNNKASVLLEIARKVLDGEIAARAGRYDEAVSLLREGVKLEDTLRYDEPPDWVQPVRHALGATLVEAGRFTEAEAVFREDLGIYPNNGWSLLGLSQALDKQGKKEEAAGVRARFEQEWSEADIAPHASPRVRVARVVPSPLEPFGRLSMTG